MFRKWLRKYLGIEEYERIKENQENINKKIAELETNINTLRELVKNLQKEMNEKIQKIENNSLSKKDLEDIQNQIKTINTIINGLINPIPPKNNREEIQNSQDDEKGRIISILQERGEMNITELLSHSGMGAKKFYKLINELKKEKKIEIIKSGRMKIVRLK